MATASPTGFRSTGGRYGRRVPTRTDRHRRNGVLEVVEPGHERPPAPRFRLNRFRTDDWAVGVARAPISAFLEIGRRIDVEWLPTPRGCFVADPFPFDESHFVAEEYPFVRGVGRLVRYETTTGRRVGAFDLLPDPAVHLSYPLVWEIDGERHVLPEQSAAERLDLYRVTGTGATRRRTLIDGIDVADATPLHVDGRWYLFFTLGNADPLGNELHIHHTVDIDSQWQVHPSSPITGGGPRWRPAGPFFRANGDLYRPSQDSTAGYGSGAIVNRVVRIDETGYEEEPITEVRSVESRYAEGCHTLTAIDDERTLVDGKRRALRLDDQVRRTSRWMSERRR